MTQTIQEYLELNKNYILSRINFIIGDNDEKKLLENKNILIQFEKKNIDKLKNYYLYKLRQQKEEYQYFIITFIFFVHYEPFFDSHVAELQKAKFGKKNIKFYSLPYIFYPHQKALLIKKKFIEDLNFSTNFNFRTDSVTLANKIEDSILDKKSDSDYSFLNYIIRYEPKVKFNKIILSDEHKNEIKKILESFSSHHLEEAKFEEEVKGTVPILLLKGYPGTGKTMLAHSIANSLNLPIIKLKPQTFSYNEDENFISNFITNLNNMKCVILIDELENFIDSTFFEMSRFLEALEYNTNLMIFTSNLLNPSNTMAPLMRRITSEIEFLIPEGKLRKQLWNFHIPKEYSFDKTIDLDKLSKLYPLAGGNIKNIMLNISFLLKKSKKITIEPLVSLIKKELEKMGFSESGFSLYIGDIAKDIHTENSNIKKIKKLISQSKKIKSITGTLPNFLIESVSDDENFFRQLSSELEKPILLYKISKEEWTTRKRRGGEIIELRDMLLNSIPSDEYFFIIEIDPSLVGRIKQEKESLFSSSIYSNYINLDINNVFFYIQGNYNEEKSIKHLFSYTIQLNNNFHEKEFPIIDKIKFAINVEIYKILEDFFQSPESKSMKNGFIQYLLSYYLIHGEKILTKKDVYDILKYFKIKKTQPPLFSNLQKSN